MDIDQPSSDRQVLRAIDYLNQASIPQEQQLRYIPDSAVQSAQDQQQQSLISDSQIQAAQGNQVKSTQTQKTANPKVSKSGNALVDTAMQYLGTPYVWGGTNPNGFDCSGLMQYTLGKNGISIPRTAREQYKAGSAVSKDNLQPGDLVFFKGYTKSAENPGHVGMYIGNGQYIQAPKTGDVVKISNLSGRSDYVGARRY